MCIINQIINELTDDSKKLSNTLLKIKVLATRINNASLLNWVNNELEGYALDNLPKYRIIEDQQIFGNLSNGYYILNQQVIPTQHLSKKHKVQMTTSKMSEGITHIEGLSSFNDKTKSLISTLPAEALPLLSKGYEDEWAVIGAYIKMDSSVFTNLLTIVKSKLLELMLALEEDLSADEILSLFTTDAIKEKANNVINNYIYNNSNVFTTNANSTQKIKLTDALASNGIQN